MVPQPSPLVLLWFISLDTKLFSSRGRFKSKEIVSNGFFHKNVIAYINELFFGVWNIFRSRPYSEADIFLKLEFLIDVELGRRGCAPFLSTFIYGFEVEFIQRLLEADKNASHSN